MRRGVFIIALMKIDPDYVRRLVLFNWNDVGHCGLCLRIQLKEIYIVQTALMPCEKSWKPLRTISEVLSEWKGHLVLLR